VLCKMGGLSQGHVLCLFGGSVSKLVFATSPNFLTAARRCIRR
jgi:hypothetical protein